MKKLYLLDDGESWWIVATSEEEALRLAKINYCIGDDLDDTEQIEIGECPSDLIVKIRAVSEDDVPDGLSVIDGVIVATAAEWCAASSVGDLIGSTVY